MSTEKTDSKELVSSFILNRLESEIKGYNNNLSRLRSFSNRVFVDADKKGDIEPQDKPIEPTTFIDKLRRDIDLFEQLNFSTKKILDTIEGVF